MLFLIREKVMNIRACQWSTAVLAVSALFGVGTATAADYTTIILEKNVDRPIDAVWTKVGEFCAIKDWMKITCEYTSGFGNLGTVRHLAGRVDEVMVAKTRHSYTYTVPTATDLYHGTLEAVADGPRTTKLIYTVFYNQEPLGTAEAKTADRERRTKTFTAALENMKALSESN